MTKKIDGIYGDEERPRELVIKRGPLGIGVYGAGELLVSAPGEQFARAILEAEADANRGGRCARWLSKLTEV